MIIKWIIRILIAYPLAYTIVSWRKIVRVFKDWRYKEKEKEKEKDNYEDTTSNSNFKTLGCADYDAYHIISSLRASSTILVQMTKNQILHQQRFNDINQQLCNRIVDGGLTDGKKPE